MAETPCPHCAAMPTIVAAAQALYDAERQQTLIEKKAAALGEDLMRANTVEAAKLLLPQRRAAFDAVSAAAKRREAANDALWLALLAVVKRTESDEAEA